MSLCPVRLPARCETIQDKEKRIVLQTRKNGSHHRQGKEDPITNKEKRVITNNEMGTCRLCVMSSERILLWVDLSFFQFGLFRGGKER